MENNFYVYTHDKFANGKWIPFYVGKGKGNRFKVGQRNKWHARVAKKYETRATVWRSGLEEKTAFDGEKELVSFLKEEGFVLTNMSDGGEGQSGYTHTKETKIKIGDKSRLWKRPPALGAKISKRQLGENNSAKLPGVGGKISAALSGRIWATNGNEDFLCFEHEMQIGWRLGRSKYKHPSTLDHFLGCTKGTVWVTNGKESKRQANCLSIPEGWVRGRKKNG